MIIEIKEMIEKMIVNKIELIIENLEHIKINNHKKIRIEEVKEKQEDHIIIIITLIIGIIKEIIKIRPLIEEDIKINKIEENKEEKEDQEEDIIGMMMNNDHIYHEQILSINK